MTIYSTPTTSSSSSSSNATNVAVSAANFVQAHSGPTSLNSDPSGVYCCTKTVLLACYSPIAEAEKRSFSCNLCNKTIVAEKGNTNALSHLKSQHRSEWTHVVDEYVRSTTHTLEEYYDLRTTDGTRNLYKLIEFVIMNDLPFSFVENTMFRNISNLKPVCQKTLMNGLRKMYAGLKRHVSKLLPESFGLVFDGWSTGNGAHLLGCFATFPSEGSEMGEQVMLGVNQLSNPTNQTAANHVESISQLLQQYERSLDAVLFLVGDTCTTNRATAEQMDKALVPCANHLLALAAQKYIAPYTPILNTIHSALSKIKKSSNATQRLKQYTDRRITLGPRTRWNAALTLTETYLDLSPVLERHATEIGGPDLAAKIVGPYQRSQLERLLPRLREFHNATQFLQGESVNLADVRAVFEELMRNYARDCADIKPYLESYGTYAKHCSPDFVSGVTLLQQGRYSELTANQLEAIECLSRCPVLATAAAPDDADGLSLVETALARAKRARRDDSLAAKFGNTNYVLPTSNICERAFSRLKLIFRDRRQCMTMDNLEMVAMLRFNRHLWNVEWLLDASLDDDTLMLEDGDYLDEDFFSADEGEDDI